MAGKGRNEQDDDIPQNLRDYFAQKEQPPRAMLKCKTFYEAVRAAGTVNWHPRIKKYSALSAWATAALVVHKGTRHYIAKLIQDEATGFQWEKDHASAVCVATDELQRDRKKDRKRKFEQDKNAAIKAIHELQSRLRALGYDPSVRELSESNDLRRFSDHMRQFESLAGNYSDAHARNARNAAVASGATATQAFMAAIAGLKVEGWEMPHLDRLLQAAESQIEKRRAPTIDRHKARGLYLRALYCGLEHSEIASRRVAFLVHASKAVFGEDIDKRGVRRLIADHASTERKLAAWYAGEDARFKEMDELIKFLEVCDAKPTKGKRERDTRLEQLRTWKEKLAARKEPDLPEFPDE